MHFLAADADYAVFHSKNGKYLCNEDSTCLSAQSSYGRESGAI